MVPARFQKISAVFRDVIMVHVSCYFCSLSVYFTLHSGLPDLRKPTRSRSNNDCFIFVCAKSVGILEEPEVVRLSWIKVDFFFLSVWPCADELDATIVVGSICGNICC